MNKNVCFYVSHVQKLKPIRPTIIKKNNRPYKPTTELQQPQLFEINF